MKPLSRMVRLAVVALPATLLMACSVSDVPKMNLVDMAGDDFNHNLARNYKTLANFEAYEMHDWSDAVLYANKATASSAGSPPAPDDLSKRSIKGADKVAELQGARGRLAHALKAGAARMSPVNAASAQANFDCWAEQQEEGWQHDHIAACKDGFWRAMLATETAMAPAPVQQPPVAQRTAPVPAMPVAAQPLPSFRVFFDWDKSELTADARRLIDQAIQRGRAIGQGIHLVGHADSSGPDPYNMLLSQRRIDAVERHLTANGVARNAITSEARGEHDALLPTADGVREPQNRNVSIELFTHTRGT